MRKVQPDGSECVTGKKSINLASFDVFEIDPG